MLERIGVIIEKLFGPLADRAADRIADRLTPKLPDLSNLDDQIVAKLPDLSNLPKQIGDVLTATLTSIPGSITGGIGAIVDGIFKRDR